MYHNEAGKRNTAQYMLSIEFYGRIGSKKFIKKGSIIGQFPSPSNINLNNAIFSTLLSSYFPTVR
jgi:hypothetical protein